MTISVTHVGGPVPVKRAGEVHVSTLPADARRALVAAVAAVRKAKPAQSAKRRPPDVGGTTLRIDDDEADAWELEFSDAEATEAQLALLALLRPYLKVVPWT